MWNIFGTEKKVRIIEHPHAVIDINGDNILSNATIYLQYKNCPALIYIETDTKKKDYTSVNVTNYYSNNGYEYTKIEAI